MKYPLLITVLSTSLLFTGFGLAGMTNIYSGESRDIKTTPFLSSVFTGINDGIYPWDIFDTDKREAAKSRALEIRMKEEEMRLGAMATPTPEPIATPTPRPIPTPTPKATPRPTPTPTPEPTYTPRYEPLRETTYDEYINHVSADIFGEDGVNFAAQYPFKTVDISYFDDALFVGDSRTVGLKKYTDMSQHADFLCETSMSIQKVFKSNFKGQGKLEDYLTQNDYGKVYVMLGINELGLGTTEDYLATYTEMIDRIHELEPEAKIFIEAIMNIDKSQSDSDKVFNNTNILGRNRAIATLADNVTFFYIDANEVLCDEEGYLREDLRGDHLHLRGSSNEVWKEFLLKHGV